MRKIIFALALCAVPAFGIHQQIALNALSGSVTASGSPYSTAPQFRTGVRFSTPSAYSGNQQFLTWNGSNYRVIWNGGTLVFQDFVDGIPSNEFGCGYPVPTSTDLYVQFQKNTTTNLLSIEYWNVNGGAYLAGCTATMSTPTPGLTGTITLGDGFTNLGTVAFIHWSATPVPYGGAYPPSYASAADLGDWEFSGNANDTSGHGLNFSGLSSATYSNINLYNPTCIVTPLEYTSAATFPQGTPITTISAAASFSSNDANPVTVAWSQLSGDIYAAPSTLSFSSTTALTPTITNNTGGFGSYLLQAIVTDDTSLSSTCTGKFGQVVANTQGLLSIPGTMGQIIGPELAVYANPYTTYETQGTYMSNLMLQKLNDTAPYLYQFVDYWNTALAGTVTVYAGLVNTSGTSVSYVASSGQGFLGLTSGDPVYLNGTAYGGTVNVASNGTSITWASGTQFVGLVGGIDEIITINGVGCNVATVSSATALTCSNTLSGAPFTGVSYGSQWYALTGTATSSAMSVTPSAGTQSSIAYSSPVVVGNGTAFLTGTHNYCVNTGGAPYIPISVNGSAPYIPVWYQIGTLYGANVHYGRYFGTVASCTSDTKLTLTGVWPYSGSGADPYYTPGSGLSYAYSDQGVSTAYGNIGGWLTGNAPGNYYDNALALYTQYFVTGYDQYLQGARQIEHGWFTGPQIDQGVAMASSWSTGHGGGQNPRNMAIVGLYVWNADSGGPGYDISPGLFAMSSYTANQAGSQCTQACEIGDIREQGYALTGYSLCSRFSTTNASTCTTYLTNVLTYMYPTATCGGIAGACGQQPGGNFVGTVGGAYSSWGNGGTATVANTGPSGTGIATYSLGSWSSSSVGTVTEVSTTGTTAASGATTVTLASGAGITSGWSVLGTGVAIGTTATISGSTATFSIPTTAKLTNTTLIFTPACNQSFGSSCNAMWFTSTGTAYPYANSQGDAIAYEVYYDTINNVIQLCDNVTGLPVAYAGTVGSGKGWEISNLVGYGTEIFMGGISAHGLYEAALAVPSYATTIKGYLDGWASYLNNNGIEPGYGTFYARAFVNCEPYSTAVSNNNCNSGGIATNGEALNAASDDLLVNPGNATAISLGNVLMGAMWTCPTFMGVSCFGATSFYAGGYFYTGTFQHKWLGYYWGIGNNRLYAALFASTATPRGITPAGYISGAGVIAKLGKGVLIREATKEARFKEKWAGLYQPWSAWNRHFQYSR